MILGSAIIYILISINLAHLAFIFHFYFSNMFESNSLIFIYLFVFNFFYMSMLKKFEQK